MSAKQPVLLTVLIESQSQRWFVAGVDLEGNAVPLICSHSGDLAGYVGQPFGEQASFLRHRLSGVLQRGCDRLWGRNMKPCQIVFVADDLFSDAEPELTQRVADHFVEWMSKPPVVFFVSQSAEAGAERSDLSRLAGEMSAEMEQVLTQGLEELLVARTVEDQWELVRLKSVT